MCICTEQESIYKKVAVIGLGASGGLLSILLTKNPYIKVYGFDSDMPFSTLLPTGGGRCNLTYDEKDVKEFVKNYPRGEKFLISVFSKFNQQDTRKLFNDLDIKTYVQKDKRVFPISNSASDTVKKLNCHLKTSNFIYKREKVLGLDFKCNMYTIQTNKNTYEFDKVVVAIGGKDLSILNRLKHTIVPIKPSLCALDIKEDYLYKLSGLSFSNIELRAKINGKKSIVEGDVLFTHKSVSGPGIFKISALSAYENFNEKNPMELHLKLTDISKEEIEEYIKNNSKKTIKNVVSKFIPEALAQEILNINNIDLNKQTSQITKKEREILTDSLLNFKLHVKGRIKGSEIVSAGGVSLNEINPKTMESKLYKGLYFIGEVLDIDGFTGGFNLQNCWSGAFICSKYFNL